LIDGVGRWADEMQNRLQGTGHPRKKAPTGDCRG